jgi:cell wall-associated NlpC family hydrolase
MKCVWRSRSPSGKAVSQADARPGDLVFFYSDQHHVGMYVGNGLMVRAPRTGKPVQMAYIRYLPWADAGPTSQCGAPTGYSSSCTSARLTYMIRCPN